jgi:hypothetical protein
LKDLNLPDKTEIRITNQKGARIDGEVPSYKTTLKRRSIAAFQGIGRFEILSLI